MDAVEATGRLDLPGTKVVKEAKATTAQKSSHQNIRFWRRRAIRTIVIRPDTRKKPKAESALHVNCWRQSDRGRKTLAFEISQAGCHCEEGLGGAGRVGSLRGKHGGIYTRGPPSPLGRLPNNKRSASMFCRKRGGKASTYFQF